MYVRAWNMCQLLCIGEQTREFGCARIWVKNGMFKKPIVIPDINNANGWLVAWLVWEKETIACRCDHQVSKNNRVRGIYHLSVNDKKIESEKMLFFIQSSYFETNPIMLSLLSLTCLSTNFVTIETKFCLLTHDRNVNETDSMNVYIYTTHTQSDTCMWIWMNWKHWFARDNVDFIAFHFAYVSVAAVCFFVESGMLL